MFRTVVCRVSPLLFAAGLLAQETATEPRLFEPIDLFRLDYLMVYPAEDPVAWLDAENYLVFDAGARSMPGRGKPAWSVVRASSGQRRRFVNRAAVVKSLRGLLEDAAAIVTIDDVSAWTWNEQHTRYMMNVANDLFSGDQVAFIADHNLHIVPAAGGDVRALTTEGHDDLFYGRLDWVYQEELYGRGNFQGYWWSPDSKQIALLRLDESPVEEFVLVRETPARPEIERTNYPKAGEPNPIVDIGVIEVQSGAVKWFDVSQYPAPDRLIVRVTWAPRSQEVLFQVQGREQTWLDMLAGDVSSGEVQKLWREDSDCWVEAGPEPVFVRGGAEFLWLSERDGFRHLYHYGFDGKLKGQLTKGRGTHEIDIAPDYRTFLSRYSDVGTPPCTLLFDMDSKQLRAVAQSRPQMLSEFALAQPKFHRVPTRDGFPMEAMVLLPISYEKGKKYPVVQFCYSGPHTPRVRDEWGSCDYLWHQMLAQRGYVVFVCDNRSASGKGRKYAKACWRRLGQSEFDDLEDSVDWLVEQGYADPARLAIWGWSYGGYQTLYNLTHSKKWKCGVAVNAVTDWRNYDTLYTERYCGLPSTNKSGYDAANVVKTAANLHGDLLLYPGVRHGIGDLQQQMHLFGKFLRFLEAKL